METIKHLPGIPPARRGHGALRGRLALSRRNTQNQADNAVNAHEAERYFGDHDYDHDYDHDHDHDHEHEHGNTELVFYPA
ncbi:MAG: hypothetical protein M1457_06790 [bacterium]|nr:hypothetical protein [bacterium]